MNNLGKERLQSWQNHLVETEQLPFTQLVVHKDGKDIYKYTSGYQDVENKVQATSKTLSRIFSMTKPVTSIALMQLYEAGLFQLDDPAHLYLGENWKKQNMTVFHKNLQEKLEVADLRKGHLDSCIKNITVRMLLTHISGISYGFDRFGIQNKVDQLYFKEFEGKKPFLKIKGELDCHYDTLEEFVEALSHQPLVFQPGSGWNYGYNVEVVGRLVEVLSGKTLREYFKTKIFSPLQMNDTDFQVPEEKKERLAKYYMRKGMNLGFIGNRGKAPKYGLHQLRVSKDGKNWTTKQNLFKGGEGLVSTADDYMKFAKTLLNKGTCPETGYQLIASKTLEFMTMNHLPGNTEMEMYRRVHGFGEPHQHGFGFGLGFSVVMDEVKTSMLTSKGVYSWEGAASTIFWVDPVQNMTVVFTTQLLFRDTFTLALTPQLHNMIYGGIQNKSPKAKL
eukprot:snap_masked-scaffold_5-processed-gene-17.31-mRNA-1 protein AED:1.00 eAED:1.00 QI:0/-1/0/0/-1/1/1/0/446